MYLNKASTNIINKEQINMLIYSFWHKRSFKRNENLFIFRSLSSFYIMCAPGGFSSLQLLSTAKHTATHFLRQFDVTHSHA